MYWGKSAWSRGASVAVDAVSSGRITGEIRTDDLRHFRRRSLATWRTTVGFAAMLALLSAMAQAQIAVSAPALLNTNGTTDSRGDWLPQVATDGAGNWVAVWESSESFGTDISVARSTNYGATWTAPALLNTHANHPDDRNDYAPQVTTDGAGNWLAVWVTEISFGDYPDLDIFVARSADNGRSWTAPALLNTNGDADAGNDWPPQVTTDGAGNWIAVWQSDVNLDGTTGWGLDVLVARSADNGASWTAPALLSLTEPRMSGATCSRR